MVLIVNALSKEKLGSVLGTLQLPDASKVVIIYRRLNSLNYFKQSTHSTCLGYCLRVKEKLNGWHDFHHVHFFRFGDRREWSQGLQSCNQLRNVSG
jgi:hypothetical protein